MVDMVAIVSYSTHLYIMYIGKTHGVPVARWATKIMMRSVLLLWVVVYNAMLCCFYVADCSGGRFVL